MARHRFAPLSRPDALGRRFSRIYTMANATIMAIRVNQTADGNKGALGRVY